MVATLNMARSSNVPSVRGFSRPWLLVATAGGLGYLPLAPGTWGAGAGLLLFWWLAPLGAAACMGALAATLLLGIPAAAAAERHFGRADDRRIVIDEVAGQLLTLFPLILMGSHYSGNPVNVFLAFLLFRLFDIWKPGPVRWTEQRFHGGFGVVADDLTAGAMAAVPVWLLALATGPRATL